MTDDSLAAWSEILAMIEPLVRCLHCGWIHVGVRQPEAASDYCFRCKDFGFEVIDGDERRRAVPPWVALPALHWPSSPIAAPLPILTFTDFSDDAWSVMRGLLPDDAEVPLLLAARDATFRVMTLIMDAERRPGLTKPEAWLLDLARMSTIGRVAMLDSCRTHLLGTAFAPGPYGEKTLYARAMRMAPDMLARVIDLVGGTVPKPVAAARIDDDVQRAYDGLRQGVEEEYQAFRESRRRNDQSGAS